MEIQSVDPAALTRRLAGALRHLRSERGLTRMQVALALAWRLPELPSIESGTVQISIKDLRLLLEAYHIDDAQTVEELTAMAHAAEQEQWWFDYRKAMATIAAKAANPSLAPEGPEFAVPPTVQEYLLAISEAARLELLERHAQEEWRERFYWGPMRGLYRVLSFEPPAGWFETDQIPVVTFILECNCLNGCEMCRCGPVRIIARGDALPTGQVIIRVVSGELDVASAPLELDSDRYKQAQQLAFLLALVRIRVRQMLAAEMRRPLRSLAPIPFSPLISARDRIAHSSRSLRGPTFPRVLCPARGEAMAA